jgi:GAF domain-containing protein
VKSALKPPDEEQRLAALRSYPFLTSDGQEELEAITHLACFICECPIATISIIEEFEQRYVAEVGLNENQTVRELAFCAHTILQKEMLVVKDATQDERFADHPSVTSPPHVRFYAGLPLINSEGYALGTLCVVDVKPRELSFEQVWALESLRKHIIAHLELRRTALRLEEARNEIEIMRKGRPEQSEATMSQR